VIRGVRPWRLVAAWVLVILLVTTVPFPAGIIETGPFPIDKVVHFGLYAVLGWTVHRAVRAGQATRPGLVLLAWALGLAFGALDELHQHLVPGRDPSTLDWAADAAGYTAAFLVSSVLARVNPRSEET